MDKKDRLKALINYYSDGSKARFASKLGITPQGLSTWIARDTFDIELLYSKCEGVSPSWLMTGRGDMIESSIKNTALCAECQTSIPLLPVEAMAGFFTGEVSVAEIDCERLSIPGLRADFVIPVSGDSMEPKYFSGDMVACLMVSISDIFFQWGKVYVIDTTQGVLLKKVKKGSKPDFITLISENPEYDPIEISYSDIHHIALVKGLVRII